MKIVLLNNLYVRLDVRSSDVLGVLLEDGCSVPVVSWVREMSRMPGKSRAVVYCEGICIAVIAVYAGSFRVEMIACDHHSHGVHRRYAELREKLSSLGVGNTINPSSCPKCNGATFVAADTEAGRME